MRLFPFEYIKKRGVN